MPRHDPSPLILSAGLPSESVAALLKPYGLEDYKRADANLQGMAGEPRSRELLAGILSDLLETVSLTADPDQALTHWERFLQGANRIALFQYLASDPRMLDLLCRIFGNSPSLSQTLIRDPLLVYWLAEEQVLTKPASRRNLDHAVRRTVQNVKATELKFEALRRWKRREMLRIGVRDLLGLADVAETTTALSDLAAVLIQAAYEIVQADLRRQYGVPMHRDKGRWMPTGFAVIGMGKLGGGELNYSSDVDVIYVYEADDGRTHPGRSSQERSIPNEEYFEYLARGLTKALTEQTQEGIVFRVDLRLRAEGTVGQLARSLSQYRQYYRTRGQDWERQALLKAWPVAGDPRVGRAFVRMVRPFIFNADEPAGLEAAGVIGGIKAVKSMIDDVMERRGHARRNVKLGTGGIREIEFMVQAVQLLCGRRLPRIVHRNTLTSLIRFRRAGLISQAEQRALNDAYLFLRNVEHKLQMVHDLQTHALPESMDQLLRCAIRLGYSPADHGLALRRFMDDYRIHTARVNRMFRSLVDTPDRCSILKMALRKAKAMGRAARRSKELSVGGK